MANEERFNPWKHRAKTPTSPAEMSRNREAVEPALSDLFESAGVPAVEHDTPEILETLENLQRYGVDVPREKLSLGDTKKALEELSKERYANVRKTLFPRLLESAQAHLEPHSLTVRFLRAAVSGDRNELREVVRLMDQPVQ